VQVERARTNLEVAQARVAEHMARVKQTTALLANTMITATFEGTVAARYLDPGAQQQLATIRAQVETAEKRLTERTVFSPCAGIVRDLRIRPQQLVAPGELLVTLVGADDMLSVLAIFPGQYRPFLARGSPVRLELTGFRYAYQRLTIVAVSNEVVGPHEVRRFLGQDVADAVTLQGSQVIVQAPVPARTFHAEGRWHTYHDGMPGTAEVRVRSERLVFALVPGLKAVLEGKHGKDDRPQDAR
jgi:membrane fusion protein (multidrug efflux system)